MSGEDVVASETTLQRSASSRSIGAPNLARLSTSSMPHAYHCSTQEGLNKSEGSVQQQPLSLSLQFQEIEFLASKSQDIPRALPPDPTHSCRVQLLQRTAPLSLTKMCSDPSEKKLSVNSSPPSQPPSLPHSPPPSSHSTSSPNSQPTTPPPSLPPSPPPNPPQDAAFSPVEESVFDIDRHTDTHSNGCPNLPPPPPPPHDLPCDEAVPSSDHLGNTAAILQKIDSLLQGGTAVSHIL